MYKIFISDEDRIVIIDLLRGVLSFLVVFHHMPDSWFNLQYIIVFKHQLYLFVDIFFILSGFIFTNKYILSSYKDSLIFLRNRFLRLYPMLFLTSIIFSLTLILRRYAFNITSDNQIFIFYKIACIM